MKNNDKQMQLVEKVGISLEESIKLSPLASRIYSLLILSSYDGLTFEEIRLLMQASKSSISVNINLLLKLDYITSYTKPGDRKRYFRLSKYSSLVSLEVYLKDIVKEVELIDEINCFNKEHHVEKYIDEISLGEIFHNYLLNKQQLVEDTIEKIKYFRNKEKK